MSHEERRAESPQGPESTGRENFDDFGGLADREYVWEDLDADDVELPPAVTGPPPSGTAIPQTPDEPEAADAG
ncbi:hypothetical protein [Micromonospora sp. U21]|uniref:hypothetical protein n=1 Tax=Micromonospora sp. U21 TaxID=2824899 RepID=UPI001B38F2D3|nr:hypothetical protein [Micromonospora sp. U21]MBQ0906140.1 hypothetical protein [Micromonospora sp. U21]